MFRCQLWPLCWAVVLCRRTLGTHTSPLSHCRTAVRDGRKRDVFFRRNLRLHIWSELLNPASNRNRLGNKPQLSACEAASFCRSRWLTHLCSAMDWAPLLIRFEYRRGRGRPENFTDVSTDLLHTGEPRCHAPKREWSWWFSRELWCLYSHYHGDGEVFVYSEKKTEAA